MIDGALPRISLRARVSTVRAMGVGVAVWIVFASYYLYLGNADALLLWMILPIPFGAMLLVACCSGHVTLTLFMGAIFLSHAVLPPIFFMEREHFTRSGWTAVGNFDFDIVHFLQIYLPVLFYVAVVLIGTLLIRSCTCRYEHLQTSLQRQVSSDESATEMSFVARTRNYLGQTRGLDSRATGKRGYGILLVLTVALAAITNNWMYRHGIAMTGLIGGQTQLPFHLAGILYYSTKFLLPILLFFVYMRTARSAMFAVLLSLYALWAGFSQVSRLTLAFLFLPVLLFSYLDRRYLRFGIALLVFLLAYQWVSLSRNSVYVVSGGVAKRDVSISLVRLAWKTIKSNAVVSPAEAVFAVVQRLEGAQDVVLASQYDTAAMGGSSKEFQRIFLFGSEVSGEQVIQALYGFVPPRGFSPGTGGFSSRILQIAGSNWLVLMALGLWISLLLAIGEGLAQAYSKVFLSRAVGFLVAAIYILLLYFLGFPSWLYTFVIVASLAVFVHTTTCLTKCST